MGRTIQGPTLGGDFVVAETKLVQGMISARLSLEAEHERADVEFTAYPQRFKGRMPKQGERMRVVIGLTPLEAEEHYDDPREVRVGVPASLLYRMVDAVEDEGLRGEVQHILGAVEDYITDEGAAS